MVDRLTKILVLVSAPLSAFVVDASDFACTRVDPDEIGHQHVFYQLAQQKGIDPVEIAYCDHERYPRWVARWAPFEESIIDAEIWRRFATASCFDQPGEVTCRITDHVVAGDSHVVVDIPRCQVATETIAAIYNAITRDYPAHEMKEIEFVTVTDGGAWSAAKYGYTVQINAPPDYQGGTIHQMVERCEVNGCAWRATNKKGHWMGGSLALPELRRQRDDPMIEAMVP